MTARPRARSALWSEKSYGDFELVVDWRFQGAGERGLYIRGTTKREVALKSDKKGAWHRSILRLKGEQLTLRTNKALVGETRFEKLPGAGPIALVGMDGPVQFRNIFIRELKAGE